MLRNDLPLTMQAGVIRRLLAEGHYVFVSLAKTPTFVLDSILSAQEWELVFRALCNHIQYRADEDFFKRIRQSFDRQIDAAIHSMEVENGQE